jgi:hypothetical protein
MMLPSGNDATYCIAENFGFYLINFNDVIENLKDKS